MKHQKLLNPFCILYKVGTVCLIRRGSIYSGKISAKDLEIDKLH